MPLKLNFCQSSKMVRLLHNSLISVSGPNPVMRSVGTSEDKILPATSTLKRFWECWVQQGDGHSSLVGTILALLRCQKNFSGERQHLRAPARYWAYIREALNRSEKWSRGSSSLPQQYKGHSVWSTDMIIQTEKKKYNPNSPQVCYSWFNSNFH